MERRAKGQKTTNVGTGSVSGRCWKERACSPTLHLENIDDDDDDDDDDKNSRYISLLVEVEGL